MKIVWEHSIYVGNIPVFCAICGCPSHPVQNKHKQILLAVIYDEKGIAWGEACRDCVSAGSETIQARLQERLQSLQKKIEELQMLAAEKIETPSLEQEFQIHQQDAL
jgi:Zn-finger protein